MRKFRFRFEQVLEFREIQERLAQERFAEALSAQREAEERLEEMRRYHRESLDTLSGVHQGILDIRAVSAYEHYREALESVIAVQTERVRALAEATEEKRKSFVEALKNRKVMDKMKEHERLEYLSFIQKVEQNFLDEIATIRYRGGGSAETPAL
ncbi:MAG: flagellar export protein FliJ [Armatimonadetes bacterium]|nr:flagellar export protein FliJ [Armatimonadota bacterium]